MSKPKPRYKQAIRSMFEGIEDLVKRLTGLDRLSNAAVTHMKPLVKSGLNEPTSDKAVEKLLAGFASWIEAAHVYRHAQVDDDPVDAPEALAIALISQGASWLRFLLDTAVKK